MSINELRTATDQAVAAEIRSIEARLAVLRGDTAFNPLRPNAKPQTMIEALKGLGNAFASATAQPKTNAVKRRKSRRVSPQQEASRKIQGKFLSLIRRIPKTRRAIYSAMAKEAGREVAIEAMRALR